MTSYLFTTPTVQENQAGGGPLFARYKIDRGVTVLRKDGIYSSYRYPSQQQIAEADEIYMGGTETIIDQATAQALTEQGYGAYITESD